MKRQLLLLASTLALLASSAFAQTKVPALINYQGNVRNAAGVAIGAGTPVTRTVTFRFYSNATSVLAADRLWAESQSVTILDGNFSVLIGNGAPVTGQTNTGTFAEVFGKSTTVYLGVTVDDGDAATTDAEISPRQQLVTTAFAFRATVAESVDSSAITGPMIAANAVTTTQLNASAVTAEKIAAGAVTSTQILNGTIGVDKLGTGAVTTDKILDGTIATADMADSGVTTAKIADSSITTAKILDGAIATADMADSAVTTAKIADGAIATADLADNSVTTAKIVNATVTGTDIAAGTITDANLGTNTATTVENLRIVRGSVTGEGVISAGTGFTAAINGNFVKVTFPAGTFSSIPTVVVSPWETSAGYPQYVSSITTTSFNSTGAFSGISGAARQNFTFIAIGPR